MTRVTQVFGLLYGGAAGGALMSTRVSVLTPDQVALLYGAVALPLLVVDLARASDSYTSAS